MKKFRNVNIPMGGKYFISINPLFFSIMVFAVAMLIGFSPLIMHAVGMPDISFTESGSMKMLDYICPPECARALMDAVSSSDKEYFELPGGHISLIAGRGAARHVWPKVSAWLAQRSQ